jgi:hypothetical protein
MKRRYPQDLETLSDEETEEFSPHSLPRKMATRAPPTYVIPNDVEGSSSLSLESFYKE